MVAYAVGSRADDAFLELKALMIPLGVTHYYSDKWGAYRRHLPAKLHTVGKRYLQKIERKHLTLRTRLKRLTRQTLCFSRSIDMHDLGIGLFIDRDEFGHKA
jgi:insertion element IS1 protein InsB